MFQIAILFLLMSLFVKVGPWLDLLPNKSWTSTLSGFLFVNAIGFAIPIHVYIDSLVLIGLWVVWQIYKHIKKKEKQP